MRPPGGPAHLFGADERIALQGGEMLADGHGGKAEGGRDFVDRRAVGPLEEREDLGLGGVHVVVSV